MADNIEVTIDGDAFELISDYQVEQRKDRQLDRARITLVDKPQLYNYESGDQVVVRRFGSVIFSGELEARPARSNDGSVQAEAVGHRRNLSDHDVYRVAYEESPDELIDSLVNEKAEEKDEQTVSTCDDLTDWSADFDVFRLGDFNTMKPHEYGSDVLFAGLEEGSGGRYSIRYDGVSADAAPADGRFYDLRLRALWNNSGDVFKCDVELRDHSGTNYVWDDVDIGENQFQELKLEPQNATSDGSQLQTDGTLELRFTVRGQLPEPRAIAVDRVALTPYRIRDRDVPVGVSVADVSTDREVSRRFESSIAEAVGYLAQEEDMNVRSNGRIVEVFDDDGRDTNQISYTNTPVTDYDIDTDYRDIYNRIVVKGEGSAKAAVEDPESIDYYNKQRTKTYEDETLETEEDCYERAKTLLEENAWDDSTMEFTVADPAFGEVNLGDALFVLWPPEDVEGNFEIVAVEHDTNGIPTITLGGTKG